MLDASEREVRESGSGKVSHSMEILEEPWVEVSLDCTIDREGIGGPRTIVGINDNFFRLLMRMMSHLSFYEEATQREFKDM